MFRVRHHDGAYRHHPAVFAANGRLKTATARVNGKQEVYEQATSTFATPTRRAGAVTIPLGGIL